MSDIIERIQDREIDSPAQTRIVEIADTEADEVLDALSAETRRETYQALFDDPATTSELADRLDTSVQNVHHHLSVLENVGLVEPMDTVYSTRGNEMSVYGPASDPLVFVGEQGQTAQVEQSLANVVSGIAVLGVASLVVQFAADRLWASSIEPARPVGSAGYPTQGMTLLDTIAWTVFEILEPGMVFFVACLLIAALVSSIGR